MESKPNIKPIKTKEYDVPKSKYSVVGSLPTRSIILGPSGSGKSILLQNMILDIYKGLFKRIYIFSPSIEVDYQTWKPVKDHIQNDLKLTETDKETFYFSEYMSEELEKIIDTQRKITEYQKKQEHKKLFQILIVIDDFADSPEFSRHSKLLHSLFTRGRHSQISTIVATQKFTSLHPIIRVNASELYVFRLRNYQDLETFINEISAMIDKKSLLEMYRIATEIQYSFLYCKLTAKDIKKTFMIKYDKYLTIEE
jgi:ABC-type dipeptide/oligopeptide/nickel transport system ATPase component